MNISVMLASSANFSNSGMFSVDYAAFKFFKKHYPECNIKFYVMHLSDRSLYPYEKLVPYDTYNVIDYYNVCEIEESDLIVYWSDFFHSRHFFEEYMNDYFFSADELERIEQENLFFKAFFLEGADPDIFKKTISFGNSMMFVDEVYEMFKGDRFSHNFTKLYSKINTFMPRDTTSEDNFSILSAFMSDYSFFGLGCDPAFLLHEDEFDFVDKGKIGLFVGRRSEIKISDFFKILRLSMSNKCNFEWIDWMINRESMFLRALKNPKQSKNLFLHSILRLLFKKKSPYLDNNFTSLKRFSFILTDTYHLAINSVRNSVPVYCIHDSGERVIYGKKSKDLSGLKKEVLFDMLGSEESIGPINVKKIENMIEKKKPIKIQPMVRSIETKLKERCDLILRTNHAK